MSFEIKKHVPLVLLTVQTDMTKGLVEEFKKHLSDVSSDSQIKFLIINFAYVSNIAADCFREAALLGKTLRDRGGKLYGVRLDEKMQSMIKVRGLDSAITIKANEAEALGDFNPKPAPTKTVSPKPSSAPKIDVKFINPFITAALQAVSEKTQLSSAAQKPFIKSPSEPEITWDTAMIISITSRQFCGSISFLFPQELILQIAGNEQIEVMKQIANSILEEAKVLLLEINFDLEEAFTNVVNVRDEDTGLRGSNTAVLFPFGTTHGTYHVEVAVEPQKIKAAA